MLETVDLSLSLSKGALKQVQSSQIERLYILEKTAYERKVPVIIVFEGWDAAGKGTIIRKLTERLDPRGFKVSTTQAPRTFETLKPWLWRFWMQIPRQGQMAIFDRSWYGRVLVERVEGLTPIPDWIRAYSEINEFEHTLADDGTVFIKFWLHISLEEQLRRFAKLTNDKETAWQVTAEDWEHHRKYDEYFVAVEDMVSNTSTEYAPWDIVPATDKHYRTYHVFRTIITRLEDALELDSTDWDELEVLEERASEQRKKQAKRKKQKKSKKKVKVTSESADKVALPDVESESDTTSASTTDTE